MKRKLLNLALVVTSLFGYLEWGPGNHSFLFQAEAEVLAKLFSDPLAVLHPFTVLPLVGQLLLLFTLVQREPSKRLTYIGLACLALLLVLVFFIGILGGNFRMVLSALPFLLVSIAAMRAHRRPVKTQRDTGQ